MTTGIQLVALKCSKCGTGLYVPPKSLVLYCPGCSTGFEIVEQELVPVSIYFARNTKDSNYFLPFWVFDAKLDLKLREAKSGWRSKPEGLIQLFENRNTIRFYAPAFLSDVDSDQSWGMRLTYKQPDFEYIHPTREIPAAEFSSKDAKKIAEYLFLSSEIEQKDTLRNIQYRLNLDTQFLLILGV